MNPIKFFVRWFFLLCLIVPGAVWAQVAKIEHLEGSAQAVPAAGTPRDLRAGGANF